MCANQGQGLHEQRRTEDNRGISEQTLNFSHAHFHPQIMIRLLSEGCNLGTNIYFYPFQWFQFFIRAGPLEIIVGLSCFLIMNIYSQFLF